MGVLGWVVNKPDRNHPSPNPKAGKEIWDDKAQVRSGPIRGH